MAQHAQLVMASQSHAPLPQALRYQPSVSLEDGLRQFATWFKQYYGSALDVGAAVPEDWVSPAFLHVLTALH